MLLFGSDDEGFADDSDPELRYRLPTGLHALPDAHGLPQAVLARTPEGGMLQLRLGATWPTLGDHERRALLSDGRFRLRWHTPAASPSSSWHAALIRGEALVDRALSLSPAETAIARLLVPDGQELLDVELELSFEGRHPTYPWVARVDGPALQSRVLALLGSDEPTTWADVEDAFAGLTMDTFEWFPLEPRVLPPPTDDALRALARHAAPLVLTRSSDRYVASPEPPATLDLSLAVARAGTRRFGLRWSFSEFLAAQPDPEKHLIELHSPEPFEAAIVQLVNDVPLSHAGIRSIEVEIKTGGRSGRLSHTFEVGEPSAARLTAIRGGYEPLALEWRTHTIVVIGGRPTQVATDFRPGGQSIRVDTGVLGLVPLRMAAEPIVFEYVDAVEITLGRRTLRLTATAPEAWAVGRRPPSSAPVEVVLSGDIRASLGELPIGPRGLSIGVAELGVGEAATVVVRPPADLDTRAAYLALQIEDGPWRTLESGQELRWSVLRPTRLHTPQLRYRSRHVPRLADGSTTPIVESAWREAEGEVVEVEVKV